MSTVVLLGLFLLLGLALYGQYNGTLAPTMKVLAGGTAGSGGGKSGGGSKSGGGGGAATIST